MTTYLLGSALTSVAELITSISALVGAVAWPAAFLTAIFLFRDGLREFFNHLAEFTLKAPGVEATARRQDVEAAVAVGRATSKSSAQGSDEEETESIAAQLVNAMPDRRSRRHLQRSVVLWADDQPDNNRYEREALGAFGVHFVLVTSTDDALAQLKRQTFELVISDMSRPPDRRAGYTLLDAMRREGYETPFLIYAGSGATRHAREAKERGAIGATNSPQELIAMVTEALR